MYTRKQPTHFFITLLKPKLKKKKIQNPRTAQSQAKLKLLTIF